MSDRERVPWVTRTSLHRSGRAIVASITAWVDRRTGPPAGDSDLDPRIATALSVMGARNAFEDLAADRSPQFPTVTDEDFSDQRTYEPTDIPERSDADEVLGFVLVGLAGLVALCAIYPALILWIISLARGWGRAHAVTDDRRDRDGRLVRVGIARRSADRRALGAGVDRVPAVRCRARRSGGRRGVKRLTTCAPRSAKNVSEAVCKPSSVLPCVSAGGGWPSIWGRRSPD